MLSSFIKEKILTSFNISYLVIGTINTLFGYWIGIGSYFLFYKKFGIFFVGIIANILSITFTYTCYKFFLFKTKGKFLSELIKSFLNYSFAGLLSILTLWILVEILKINIFLSQFLILPLIFVVSYFGNKFYVFKK